MSAGQILGADQPELFDASDVVIPARNAGAQDPEQQFRAFHEANPEIYRALKARALALYATGARHIGMRMLWEVLRYEHTIKTQGSRWKLNNNLLPYYSRLLRSEVPLLADCIETRGGS